MYRELRERCAAHWDALVERWAPCPPQVVRYGGYAMHFAAGMLLGAGVFLDRCSPFGAAFAGACGGSLSGAFALLGVCVGSFLALPFADALRYAAAAILIFAVAYAFSGTRAARQSWFMPATVMSLVAITGVTTILAQKTMLAVLYLVTEILLAGFCCLCYRIVFSER